ncbi:MAG: DUF916 and DUF3324 domain-containing protein [Streptococcaceae bacterium]|nr:DUF916 and DUF3324 domain-containing protein [Streptococcaceae bacterium]
MRERKSKFSILLAMAFLWSCLCVATGVGRAETVGFHIGADESPLQHDKTRQYFDLRVTPQTRTTCSLYIHNTSKEKATFHLQFKRAATNTNQVIVYDKETENKVKPAVNIESLVKLPLTTVDVPENSSKKIPIQIRIAGKKFKGKLIGGITVTKVVKKKMGRVNNVYSYLKSVVLTQEETMPRPNILRNGQSLVNNYGLYQIAGGFKNPIPEMIQLKSTIGTVRNKKTKQVYKVNLGMGQIAPNSSFKVLFNQGKVTPKGDYLLDLTMTSTTGRKWHFKDSFSFDAKDKFEFPRTFIKSEEPGNANWWDAFFWRMFFLFLLSLLLLLLLLALLKRRKEDEEKRRLQQKVEALEKELEKQIGADE